MLPDADVPQHGPFSSRQTPLAAETTDPVTRKLRHDVRGCMHGLQLVISALETPLPQADALEFIDDLLKACERMNLLIDQLEARSS